MKSNGIKPTLKRQESRRSGSLSVVESQTKNKTSKKLFSNFSLTSKKKKKIKGGISQALLNTSLQMVNPEESNDIPLSSRLSQRRKTMYCETIPEKHIIQHLDLPFLGGRESMTDTKSKSNSDTSLHTPKAPDILEMNNNSNVIKTKSESIDNQSDQENSLLLEHAESSRLVVQYSSCVQILIPLLLSVTHISAIPQQL